MLEFKSAVMAVPWEPRRAKKAASLRKQLGTEVIWDQKRSIMDTFSRALEYLGREGGLLLQDDVILAPDFEDRVTVEIAAHYYSVIQFFSMTPITESQWVKPRHFIGNLCVYIPPLYAAPIREYIPTYLQDNPKDPTADDFVIREWLKRRREEFYLRAPSLVQHEKWRSSVNPTRSTKRIAPLFEGEA